MWAVAAARRRCAADGRLVVADPCSLACLAAYAGRVRPLNRLGYKVDPKILNAANFICYKEDHTLGNLVRMRLMEDPNVRYAGYRHPHPLEIFIELKVRTNGVKDPLDALKETVMDLSSEINTLENRFREARDRFHPENHYEGVGGSKLGY